MGIRKACVKRLNQLINLINRGNSDLDDTGNQIDSLAPKILTDEEDIKRIQPYLDSLKKVIEAKNITNIALTGNYGSGKSTILNTFQYLNPKHSYLNISLASFKDNKNDDDELERKLEISILQQIFYHVKPSDIPDSRFKRIVNITTKKLWAVAIGFIFWLASLIILFKFGYIEKLNPETWNVKYNFDWLALLIISTFFTGVGISSKLVIRLFSNSKINKFNIKGELELGNEIDKSVFNEHLEEIVYFFERTNYNIIIIEDLDRFESTDIFTKLREINILLNNSKLIHREINFIYAVRDEMFNDKNERVKFFEYIIPVIPFINPSNAGEQLAKLIENANLKNILTKDFTEDIVTFIDDIDMRLLTNIFHEYQLYKNNLSSDLNQDNLFAIIVYKNMFPDDFGQLHKRSGKLYNFIAKKDSYIKKLLENIDNRIVNKQTQIKNIKKESVDHISDLKSIYINAIHINIPQAISLQLKNEVLFSDLAKDINFDLLQDVDKIGYYQLNMNTYYSNKYDKVLYHSKMSFSDIEKYVNRDFTYQERKQQVLDKSNEAVQNIQLEIEKLKNEKQEIESWTLKQIFEEVDIEIFISDFAGNLLIRNLLINGYINENYDDYISLFHEVNLTKEDYSFLRNIKSGISTIFDYQLNKIENIIKKIPEKYFKREVILNFDLLDFLVANANQYKNQYDSIIKLLSNEKRKSVEFIFSYIDKREPSHHIFIKSLCKSWENYWNYIYQNNDYSNERKLTYLRLIIKYADLTDISRLNKDFNLSNYISECSSFLSIVGSEYYNKIKKLIEDLNIKFISLESSDNQNKELLNYIYENNYYQINEDNILLVINEFGNKVNLEKFKTANYTTISNSNCSFLITYINDNITSYIRNVFLKLPDNNRESESVFISLLNNKRLYEKIKIEIISKQDVVIEDIEAIDSFDIQQNLLINNKISPNWDNLFFYYSQLEDKVLDESLISFLNQKSNYNNLDSISLSHPRGRDFIKEFTIKLIFCEELIQESYENIISATPFTWNSLGHSIKNLSVDKVKYLLGNILTFTKSNFDELKAHFPNLHIQLLERYSKFIKEKFNEFEYVEDDIALLLKSQNIPQNVKVDVIEIMNKQFILDNKEIRELSSIILANSRYIELDYNVIESIFMSVTSIDTRIKILNKNFDNYSDSEIQCLIQLLGRDYKRIFIKQNKPTFKNNDIHYNLFEKLQSKDLIIRFETIKDGRQLRVIALYN